MKKIKIINLILFLSYLLVIGCKDNSVNTSNNSNTFSGKIENWNYGSHKTLYEYASGGDSNLITIRVDSCIIDSNGNFTIHYTTPPDSVFSKFNFANNSCTNNIVINPTGTKYSYIYFEAYDTTRFLGNVQRISDNGQIHQGQCREDILFFDRITSVTGIDSCNYSGTINVSVYNANFNKGWNSTYLTYEIYNQGPPFYEKMLVNTVQPQSLKWYIFAYLYKDLKNLRKF